ncbi:MAG: antibiotic biosynthesis monooxygenase [Saprospiraceae bacterium]
MITRIVHLQIGSAHTAAFTEIFHRSRPAILAQPGCRHVECLQDEHDPTTFFTYSHWDSEADLNAYRKSEFFGSVWPATKALLTAPPRAWTCRRTDGTAPIL